MKVLETTVKGLNDECEARAENKIPSETDVIAKASNNVVSSTDSDLATKKAATKRIKQAVAEPCVARLNSFRSDSTRSPRSVMEQRRMSHTGTRG